MLKVMDEISRLEHNITLPVVNKIEEKGAA